MTGPGNGNLGPIPTLYWMSTDVVFVFAEPPSRFTGFAYLEDSDGVVGFHAEFVLTLGHVLFDALGCVETRLVDFLLDHCDVSTHVVQTKPVQGLVTSGKTEKTGK